MITLAGSDIFRMLHAAAKRTCWDVPQYGVKTRSPGFSIDFSIDLDQEAVKMLDLQSPVWASIVASPGGDGLLTARLLGQLRDGDESASAELYQQVCHQYTVGETAFVAAPHLVAIAHGASLRLRVDLLSTIGSIVASMQYDHKGAARLRDEWKAEFLLACDAARNLAAATLQAGDLEPLESFHLIGALAALHGHISLAFLIFNGGPKIWCPMCGKYIE